MKKILIPLAAVMAISACSKEPEQHAQNENTALDVTIEARIESLDVRTSMDREESFWENEDLLSVLVRNGEGFGKNTLFVRDLDKGSSAFHGTLSRPASPDADWYLFYPYQKECDERGEEREYLCRIASGTQVGPNSQEHLTMPLWGFGKMDASGSPVFQLHHAASLIQVDVTNMLEKELTVLSISVVSDKYPVNGVFNARTSASGFEIVPAETAAKKAVLKIQDVLLHIGESGRFYIMTAPIPLKEGESVEIIVETDQGEDRLSYSSPVPAGMLAKVDFKFNPGVDPDPEPEPEPGFDPSPLTFQGKTYIPVFLDMDNDGKVDAGEVWLDRNIGADSNEPGSAWGEDGVNWNSVGNFYYWGRPYAENSPCAHEKGADPERNTSWELMDGLPGHGVSEGTWTGICPEGYRIPTEREWRKMFNFIAETGFDQSYANAPSDRVRPFSGQRPLDLMMNCALKFPMTGIHDRDLNSGAEKNNKVGTLACYWSSTLIERGAGSGKAYPIRVIMGKHRDGYGQANIGPAKSEVTTASVRCIRNR